MQLETQKRCCYLKKVALDFVLLVLLVCPIQVISLSLWIKLTMGQSLLLFPCNYSSFFSYVGDLLVTNRFPLLLMIGIFWLLNLFSPSNSLSVKKIFHSIIHSFIQKSPFFAVLMYSLYDHPRYFKFQRKYQQHGPCFQTIFPFLMTMLLENHFTLTLTTLKHS